MIFFVSHNQPVEFAKRYGQILKELKLTEGRCTGIPTIRWALAENGSPPARFSTDEGRAYFLVDISVIIETYAFSDSSDSKRPEVRLTLVLKGEMSRRQLQSALDLKDNEHFRNSYLLPALDANLIEMTIPDAPRSTKQRYRLTPEGQKAAESARDVQK